MTYVYAVAHLISGDPVFVWLSKADVDARRARSRAAQSGPWVTDYEAMAKKTAVRALFPWLPQSVELATAVAIDEAVERGAPQGAVMPASVLEALAEHGLEVNVAEDEDAEPAPPASSSRSYDDALGEREPGEDDDR